MSTAPLEAANLTNLPGIRHGFFTRQGGVSEGLYASLNCGLGSGDDASPVLENRRLVARHLGGSSDGVTTLYQEHGTTALEVSGAIAETFIKERDIPTAGPTGGIAGGTKGGGARKGKSDVDDARCFHVSSKLNGVTTKMSAP